MNGMLQRLAAQARHPRATDGAARIRSAASTHTHLGIATRGDAQDTPTLQPATAPTSAGHADQTISRPMNPAAVRAQDSPHTADAAVERRSGFNLPSELLAQDVAPFSAAPYREVTITGMPALQPAAETAAAAPHTIAPARTAFELPRQAQSGAEREPTEVHVHIGRIEVAAVQDATPASKARAAPRKTVPLADYLARGRS